jgi:hypothetical protein
MYEEIPMEEFDPFVDVYNPQMLEDFQEDDALSCEEAAFMQGYLAS